jgi:hypothetical protein
MNKRLYIIIYLLLSIVHIDFLNAKIIGTVKLDERRYYIDLLAINNTAQIWLRTSINTCSNEDILLMELEAMNTTIIQAEQIICRAKKYYNNFKTIIGCTSVLASGVCAIATPSSGGALFTLCSTIFTYTANKGLADCIDGLSSIIARELGKEKEWSLIQIQASISSQQWLKIIDDAIDQACADLKSANNY